jgi:hypothetical protein
MGNLLSKLNYIIFFYSYFSLEFDPSFFIKSTWIKKWTLFLMTSIWIYQNSPGYQSNTEHCHLAKLAPCASDAWGERALASSRNTSAFLSAALQLSRGSQSGTAPDKLAGLATADRHRINTPLYCRDK